MGGATQFFVSFRDVYLAYICLGRAFYGGSKKQFKSLQTSGTIHSKGLTPFSVTFYAKKHFGKRFFANFFTKLLGFQRFAVRLQTVWIGTLRKYGKWKKIYRKCFCCTTKYKQNLWIGRKFGFRLVIYTHSLNISLR